MWTGDLAAAVLQEASTCHKRIVEHTTPHWTPVLWHYLNCLVPIPTAREEQTGISTINLLTADDLGDAFTFILMYQHAPWHTELLIISVFN